MQLLLPSLLSDPPTLPEAQASFVKNILVPRDVVLIGLLHFPVFASVYTCMTLKFTQIYSYPLNSVSSKFVRAAFLSH